MVIQKSDVDFYQTQGFVHLRGVLDDRWVNTLREAIDRVENEKNDQPRVANMSAMKRAAEHPDGFKTGYQEATQETNDFLIAHNSWQWNDKLRQVAFESPMAEMAAELMGSTAIKFYFDQVFIKPAGSGLRTQFHQDLGYWTCKGDQICTFWTAIDSVTRSNGAMGYVPGSHKWDENFKANFFVSAQAIPGQVGSDLPDIEANEEKFGVVYCDCEPGDIIVHHVKTVHGSTGNTTSDRQRRSVGFRYTGDDVTYHLPPGLPPDSTPIADYLEEGDALSGALFPKIWPKQ